MLEKQKLNDLDDYCAAARNPQENGSKFWQDKEFFRFRSETYRDIQAHSSFVDSILGIPVEKIEKKLRRLGKELQPNGTIESWSGALHDGVMTWVGLSPEQLQTPYGEMYDLLRRIDLQKGSSVVDLGAGYGRMGLVLGQLWPDCRFIGYEMAQERVEIGNKAYKRWGASNAILKRQNVAAEDFDLPKADFFFIYDFGSLSDMKKLLAKLDALADEKRSFSVIARGRGINALIQQTAPWLTVNVIEEGNSVIYTFV